MKTKNFAHFGLFKNGSFELYGDMLELLEKAQDLSSKNEDMKYSIAQIEFIDSEEMTSIEMGIEILSYRNIQGTIYITTTLV